MADAIVRTLWRLGVSRRHLLEWIPAAQATIGPSSRLAGLRAPNGGRDRHWRGRGDCRLDVSAWILAAGASLRRALGGFAGRRALCQPVSWRVRGRLPIERRRRAGAEADRAPHLAVLRDFRHVGRQHAAARQFSGRSGACGRASDLADQHRPLSSFRRLRSRFRLDRNRPGDRSVGGDARDHGSHAAHSRSFLQLVRHARSSTARAADTYPPSTAAIWRGISSRSPMPAGNGATVPSTRRGASAASPTRSTSRAPNAPACATAVRPRP